MKKIISLFQRNYDTDHLVRNEVVPGAEWVLAGEGIGTRKWDGTCCLYKDGKLFKRYDAKQGKTPPAGFIPAQNPDPKTGHWPGWLAIGDGPEDQWFREGLGSVRPEPIADGTYELVGPKVNGNPEGYARHVLIRHGWGDETLDDLKTLKRDFDSIRDYLANHRIEGIVWHHPDGRMVKIKTKDFFRLDRKPR